MKKQSDNLWDDLAVAGKHVVSMTVAVCDRGWVDSVATCQCGWTSRKPNHCWREQDQAVRAHWRGVIDAANGMQPAAVVSP